MGGGAGVFSANDVVHPFDEAARRQLDSLTGLRARLRAVLRVSRAREAAELRRSGCRRLGPEQLPEIYRLLPPICAAFGIAEPDLYLAAGEVNAYTLGHPRTSIVICSGLLDRLAPDEVEAVIARECGHILLRHVRYRSLTRYLDAASETGAAGESGAAGELGTAGEIGTALTAWSHKSELSADRAAAAYLGDADAITRVMFRFAGTAADSSMLAVRVREIQAWTATPGFARLRSRLQSGRRGTALPQR